MVPRHSKLFTELSLLFLGFGLRQASSTPLEEVISQYPEVSVFARGKENR